MVDLMTVIMVRYSLFLTWELVLLQLLLLRLSFHVSRTKILVLVRISIILHHDESAYTQSQYNLYTGPLTLRFLQRVYYMHFHIYIFNAIPLRYVKKNDPMSGPSYEMRYNKNER